MNIIAERAHEFLLVHNLPLKPKIADIVNVCGEMGIKVFSYSQGECFLQNLNIREYKESHRAFTVMSDGTAAIFYADDLAYEDKLIAILHEIGHICLKHTYNGVLGFSESENKAEQETEANMFALCLLGPPAVLDRCNAHTIKAIESTTGLSRKYSLKIAGLAADFDRTESPSFYKKIEKRYRKNILSAFLKRYKGRLQACLMALIMCLVIVMGFTIFKLANPPKTVYVAQGGRVYHLADCYHIRGVKTVAMTEDQAIDQYCAPCKDCDP